MLPEGGSREDPALRRHYLSPALEEFPPWEWGEVESPARGSWERNRLARWCSPAPRRIWAQHVCMYVYLGAFTHRHEFSSGYMVSQNFEAVKEYQLDSASLGHHSSSLDHQTQPATTPQLLPRAVHPLPAPCVCPHGPEPDPMPQVCSAGFAAFSPAGTTGSPRLCPSSINLTPAFCGCFSSSPCPMQSVGRGRDQPHAWEPTPLAALCHGPRTPSEHCPGSCAQSISLSLPNAPPKQGGSSQACPVPCWGTERSRSPTSYWLRPQGVPTAAKGQRQQSITVDHGALPPNLSGHEAGGAGCALALQLLPGG